MEDRLKLAMRLIRFARLLVAKNWTSEIQRKRPDLDADAVNEIIQGYHNAKKEKMVAYWLLDRKSDLDRNCDFDFFEDEEEIDKAFQMLERQHLDYQKFGCPKEVLNRDDKSTVEIGKRITFRPDSEPAFSDRKNLGHGITVYWVKDDKEGQIAVRRAIDANWGYDSNPWCLAARKEGFDPDEVEQLTEEQKERLGFYSDDTLSMAWTFWSDRYTKYPKRIAFQNGRLLAFSAGNRQDIVEWWNRNDKSFWYIPGTDGLDDREFLEQYGKRNLSELKHVSQDEFEDILMSEGDRHDEDGEDEEQYNHVDLSDIVVTQDMVNRIIEKNDTELVIRLLECYDNMSDRDMIRICRNGDDDVRMEFCRLQDMGRKLPSAVVDMILFESGDYIRKMYVRMNSLDFASANSMRRLYGIAKANNEKLTIEKIVGTKKCPLDIAKEVLYGDDEELSDAAFWLIRNKKSGFDELIQKAVDDHDFVMLGKILSTSSDYYETVKDQRLRGRIYRIVFDENAGRIDEILKKAMDQHLRLADSFFGVHMSSVLEKCSDGSAERLMSWALIDFGLIKSHVDILIGRNDPKMDMVIIRRNFKYGVSDLLTEKQLRRIILRNTENTKLIDFVIEKLTYGVYFPLAFKESKLPEDIVVILARKGSRDERLRMIRAFKDYPSYIVDILAGTGDDMTALFSIAEIQQNISDRTGMMIAGSNSKEAMIALARSKYAPPSALAAMSDCGNENAMLLVASNPRTPHDALRKIYGRNGMDSMYLENISRNSNIPRDIASKILRSTDEKYDKYRFQVLENSRSIDDADIEYMATHDMSRKLKVMISGIMNLPARLFKALAESDIVEVLDNITTNPNAPENVLRGLLGHRLEWVGRYARRNLEKRGLM